MKDVPGEAVLAARLRERIRDVPGGRIRLEPYEVDALIDYEAA